MNYPPWVSENRVGCPDAKEVGVENPAEENDRTPDLASMNAPALRVKL